MHRRLIVDPNCTSSRSPVPRIYSYALALLNLQYRGTGAKTERPQAETIGNQSVEISCRGGPHFSEWSLQFFTREMA